MTDDDRAARRSGIALPPALVLVAALGFTVAARDAAAGGGCETIITAVSAGPTAACPGAPRLAILRPGPVTWCYQVRNTGSEVLAGVSVVDAVFGALSGSLGDVAPGSTSAPLAFSGEAILGVHGAQAAGSTVSGGRIACASGDVEVLQAAPAISLVLTATVDGGCPGHDPIIVGRGADITYCYTVTNTGEVASLSAVQVTDDHFGPEPIGRIDALAPGASEVLTTTRPMLMHDLTSFADVTATPTFGTQTFPPVTARDSVAVDVR